MSKPFQRLMRYPMLLDDMLKNTEPGHPDEELLKAALDQVKEIASHINLEKTMVEEDEKVLGALAKAIGETVE